MSPRLKRCSLLALQWSLGLTVLIEALFLAFSPDAIRSFGKTGLYDVVRIVLAWTEIAGAILFLFPPTMVVGAYSLASVILLAVLVHILHGWMNVGALIVYAAAAIAVMANRAEQS